MPEETAPHPRSADQKVVVVGAGLAAVRIAEELRSRGHRGEIVLIGNERHAPYDRPPLSKQMLRGEREIVFLRDEYESLNVTVRTGTTAVALDTGDKAIALSTGEELEYDVLVIATGASPRRLPGFENHPALRYLRTADDCLELRDALAASRRLVVIGGGFIGCAVAASARSLGRNVTILEALAHPLAKVLGPQLAALVQQIHTDEGVHVRTGVTVEDIDESQAFSHLRLSDGSTVDADLIVVGIGVAPDTDWLAGSGLDVDNGIVCDEFCRTSAQDVWAVGDVARWKNLSTRALHRVEHWTNASEMAAAAAENVVAGLVHPFAPIPYVWSDQYDLKIQSVGFFAPTDDVTVLRVGKRERTLGIYARNGVLTGAVGFSAAPQVMTISRLLAEGVSAQEAIAAVSV